MLKNTYVRIAFIIVLVIILYYLVITLARSVATEGDAQMPPAGADVEGTATANLAQNLTRTLTPA